MASENRPWLFATIPSLHSETIICTPRRSNAESPFEYRFTVQELAEFIESNFTFIVPKGEYDDDSAAATGGVSVGEYYELSAANIYGLPQGVIKKRIA